MEGVFRPSPDQAVCPNTERYPGWYGVYTDYPRAWESNQKIPRYLGTQRLGRVISLPCAATGAINAGEQPLLALPILWTPEFGEILPGRSLIHQ